MLDLCFVLIKFVCLFLLTINRQKMNLENKTKEELIQIREEYVGTYIGTWEKPIGYEKRLAELDRRINDSIDEEKSVILTPAEFYEKKFPQDYSLIKGLEDTPLYSFSSMMKFAEIYAEYIKLNS